MSEDLCQLVTDQVEREFKCQLGVDRVVWIPQGLDEDLERDEERMYYGTDGHIDLFLSFIGVSNDDSMKVRIIKINRRSRHRRGIFGYFVIITSR